MGAWIETQTPVVTVAPFVVAPVWVRGLKQLSWKEQKQKSGRTRMGAWIETSRFLEFFVHIESHPYGCVD